MYAPPQHPIMFAVPSPLPPQFMVHNQYLPSPPVGIPFDRTLHIDNVHADVTEEMLRTEFSPHGFIERVKLSTVGTIASDISVIIVSLSDVVNSFFSSSSSVLSDHVCA